MQNTSRKVGRLTIGEPSLLSLKSGGLEPTGPSYCVQSSSIKQLMYRNYHENLGGPGQDLGGLCPPGPSLEPPLCVCLRCDDFNIVAYTRPVNPGQKQCSIKGALSCEQEAVNPVMKKATMGWVNIPRFVGKLSYHVAIHKTH